MARSRRVALPGAAELFRPTTAEPLRDPGEPDEQVRHTPRRSRGTRPSRRERHDEKITVYLSAEELLDLEHTRLSLRESYGIAVDRGRVVREAIAELIADFEENGAASVLVRRLRERA